MKLKKRIFRAMAIIATGVLLTACATGPKDNISLIPSDQIAAQTSKDGLFTQPIKWEHKKPGCKGECPSIKVDSIVFPGVAILSELVDHALAVMTGTGVNQAQPYNTIAQYESYFWKTAAPRDSTIFAAKTRYRNKNLTVIELNTWQYYTGAAHGISATQFLNWDNQAKRVLGLNNILQANKRSDYIAALKQAYNQWLSQNPDAQRDLADYQRIWPFQPSENFAFTDLGLVIKYDSYQIAPYSSGQPELLIPYSTLQAILRPEYLPTP